jgi:hypothetical protein
MISISSRNAMEWSVVTARMQRARRGRGLQAIVEFDLSELQAIEPVSAVIEQRDGLTGMGQDNARYGRPASAGDAGTALKPGRKS